MSKLSDVQSRMHSLRDIEGILNAMKNLSLVEITKISRFYATQKDLFRTVQSAVADFQKFYGTSHPISPSPRPSLYVAIGSERGFCGGFNEAIRNALKAEENPTHRLIVVGRKLALKFPDDQHVVRVLAGPSAAEEIPSSISELAGLLAEFSEPNWAIVHNVFSNEGSQVEITNPFAFATPAALPPYDFPPLLNLKPEQLRPQLFEQYLFSLFYGIFYLSFMAENHERLRHMEGALSKLQEEEQRLSQMANSLRQETITEELEVIMLSVDDRARNPS